jgi:manganese-dependent ADP-ribose/CDP-alcohol diphosphatase
MRQRLLSYAIVLAVATSLSAALAQSPSVAPSPPAAPSCPAAECPLFSFGLVADVQYSDEPDRPPRAYRTSIDRLRQCVTELNRHPLDFTVQLGDLIDGNTTPEKTQDDLDRVLCEFARLDTTLYHVLGNHCLNAGRDVLRKKLDMDRFYYDFAPDGLKGWRFVVLDGNDAGYGILGSDQIKWLETTLARAKQHDERVIVLNHFALLKQAAARSRMKKPEPVRGILNRSGCVVAYLAGHEHAGGYAKDHGIHHVTLQGMIESAPRNAYAIVDVFNNRIVLHGFGAVPSRTLPFKNLAVGAPREPSPAN